MGLIKSLESGVRVVEEKSRNGDAGHLGSEEKPEVTGTKLEQALGR